MLSEKDRGKLINIAQNFVVDRVENAKEIAKKTFSRAIGDEVCDTAYLRAAGLHNQYPKEQSNIIVTIFLDILSILQNSQLLDKLEEPG